jgi:hypothetical protein
VNRRLKVIEYFNADRSKIKEGTGRMPSRLFHLLMHGIISPLRINVEDIISHHLLSQQLVFVGIEENLKTFSI